MCDGGSENHDVSVVVLTKNSARTIKECILSVLSQEPLEIIAVDGMSTDSTISLLEYYGVRIIPDPSLSLGRARQVGVEAARAKYVVFVDSDVELTADCIMTLRNELEKNGWVGIHARLLSKENLSYWQRAVDTSRHLYGFDRAGVKRAIGTVAALFRRDILLGHPFDSAMVESCEDVDLCWRLRRENDLVGVSTAIAYHYHRRGFQDFVKQRFRDGIGNARLSLKYRERRRLIKPFGADPSIVVPTLASTRITLVPYFVVSRVTKLAGMLYGLRIRSVKLSGKRPRLQPFGK
jgi:glycosyltransferase involved in cell wall biosynthesis